jgi:membrane-bound serine protease (ClpP class)
MLFDPAGPGYQVSIWVALAIAGTFVLLFMFALTKILQARRRRPVTGQEELIGQVGLVRKALDPAGFVFVRGELWQARSDGEPICVGEEVVVESLDDALVIHVRRAKTPVPLTA